jgi:hypothetical protein
VAEQSTHNPKFKGLNIAAGGTIRDIKKEKNNFSILIFTVIS